MDFLTIIVTALITWTIEKSADEVLFWVKKNIREKSSDNNEDK
ncbi:hypothetical protein B6N60_01004 [Richelia sinica FACHB-800]|uniref:Uncharacterized protein n=1 Tax=Richelia sinica FACHB-800 TaxID=1357546 RepID=A0A975T6E9_9NOST|nr:hypothetical protein [Richelia sinica]QXE22322.1 hypothetical protein B6N60_01004 [Richelia sinica FACHB-800]